MVMLMSLVLSLAYARAYAFYAYAYVLVKTIPKRSVCLWMVKKCSVVCGWDHE